VRLSLQTDYALRTLIYLAGFPGRAKVQDVADFYQISVHHVGKVVHLLGKSGLVRAVRGIGGGIEIARAADEIRVGEVVQHFEGNMHLLECVGTDGVCTIQPNCRLRGILAEAERVQLEYLNRFTIADVVQPGGGLAEFMPLLQLSSVNSLTTNTGE